jgi:pyrroline-5-carboxylate reductase
MAESDSCNTPSGRIVVIGYGNMGRALVRGLRRSGAANIIVCERFPVDETETETRTRFFHPGNAALLAKEPRLGRSDTIILCTKPQNLSETAKIWRPHLMPKGSVEKPLVVSILAGTPTDLIHQLFADDAPVVRAMPNIAATVDCAATALCASESTDASFALRAKGIFDCVGKSWIVPEDLLDVVTGLSGSGPAYIYMVIEALSDGGVKMGMPRQLALDLAAQTVLGAATLVQETKAHPAVLRDQVTTPGGTTITAIHELEKHGLRPMLISAVVTATKRSARLASIVRKTMLDKAKEPAS